MNRLERLSRKLQAMAENTGDLEAVKDIEDWSEAARLQYWITMQETQNATDTERDAVEDYRRQRQALHDAMYRERTQAGEPIRDTDRMEMYFEIERIIKVTFDKETDKPELLKRIEKRYQEEREQAEK